MEKRSGTADQSSRDLGLSQRGASRNGAEGSEVQARDARNQGSRQLKKAAFSFVYLNNVDQDIKNVNKERLKKALQRHLWFEGGELLVALEKGVKHPVISFMHLDEKNPIPPLMLRHPLALGDDIILRQGVYRRLKSFRPPSNLTEESPEGDVGRTVRVVFGFESLDGIPGDAAEENWRNWTGVRSVNQHVINACSISEEAVYKREHVAADGLFLYIATLQCENVSSAGLVKLLEAVERQRAALLGFLCAYSVEIPARFTKSVVDHWLAETIEGVEKVEI